jgi:secreted PhoX family phosphatase
VLRAGFGTAAMTVVAAACAAPGPLVDPAAWPDDPSVGLLGPDVNGVMLPAGFTSRVVARSLHVVDGGDARWHLLPDGGAVFARPDGGWTYVSNSEFVPGGVGALDFGPDGTQLGARPLLTEQTAANCAGGATPWGTWLTCEEWDGGRVWEVDPRTGAYAAHDAMGVFRHEAAAVDPVGRVVYLTEDQRDGRLYRFVPERWGDLSAGALEVAAVDDGAVEWLPVPMPQPGLLDPPTRKQVPGSTSFNGGEGTVYHNGHVWFTTKGDGRVWDLDTSTMVLSVLYDATTSADRHLRGVDNLTTAGGALYVAEDGGNMELVLVGPDGRTWPCLRVVDQDRSEIAGPAFDPSGTRLYFSSQRGNDGLGITYEVTGPFAALRDSVLAP